MGSRCRISMLGSLRAQQGEREISRFRSERTAALLAYLAYHLGESHPREVLAETIWPGQTPRAGRTSLNTALYSLRRQLEPPGVPRGTVIQSDRFAVQLNPSAVTTDVQEFEAALRRASDADTVATRVQHLTDAVRLYVGELLPGFYGDWIPVEQRRLADQYFEAALRLSALLERTGNVQGALAVTREAIARDPLREEAHCELMRLYAVAGEPLAALRQYVELKDLLARELGQTPSPAAARLAQAIRGAEFEVRTPRPSRREAATARRPDLPTGMVTFLLTDVEGVKALLASAGEAFKGALKTYRSLLGREFRRHGAQGVRRTGTSFVAPFASATEAVECAVACQKLLAAHPWPPEAGPLRVRMALYTGEVRFPEGSDRDGVLDRASRVLSAAHGGQVLCGEATATFLKRDRGLAADLAHLGTYRLRDVPTPEKLFQVTYSGMNQVQFPPLRAEAGYADNLPLQLTRFFGRERELKELAELVKDGGQRLVTLTGAGGSGKTRLALEVAREALRDFDGAVWFVPVADLRDAELIPGAIADALGLQRVPHMDPLDQVASFLREQPALLILDNLEQLGQAAGPVVRLLLDGSRSTTCLATSRRPLDLPGERLYTVPPLPTPEASAAPDTLLGCASVRLFVDRAQAARPDFQLTESNAETIAMLCERLEGIPLAIELAAARAQAMTTGQMLAQLQRPFDFLVSGRRVTEERHKALEAAIDWSYQLLPDELQRFLVSLSVFRGGCTPEAAQAVCQEPRAPEYLEELTASSLLTAEEVQGVMRFRPLETLREFGRERLCESDLQQLKRRHAGWFLELVRMYDRHWRGGEDPAWLDRIEAECDNLRAALDWCASEEGHAMLGIRLANQVYRPWTIRGREREIRACLLRALERLDANDDAADEQRAWALERSGYLTALAGDCTSARSLIERALQLHRRRGDRLGAAAALGQLGNVDLGLGNYDQTRVHYRECLALRREEDAPAVIVMSLNGLATVDLRQGDYQEAELYCQEGLLLSRDTGDRLGEAAAMYRLARVGCYRGDYEGSRALALGALQTVREFQHLHEICHVLDVLAIIALDQGHHHLARHQLEEALRTYRKMGFRRGEALILNRLGRVALAEANPALARQLHEQALGMARDMEARPEIATSLDGLGAVAAQRGQAHEAMQYRREALRLWHEMGTPREIAENLEAIAGLMATPGRAEVGATLLGVAEPLREAIGAPAPPAQRGALRNTRSTLRKLLKPSKYAAARKRGRQMTLDEAVQLALGAE
jgi:predicted ATPase/DNA-binding SARP family transcriptional activator